MSARDRIRKYRQSGGASDLVRVEVLVPKGARADIVARAALLRGGHREKKRRLEALIAAALERYGARVEDNIDLGKAADLAGKARLVASALIERGDARAFAIGRRLQIEVESG